MKFRYSRKDLPVPRLDLRVAGLSILVAAVLTIVAGRLYYLQVVQHKTLAELADRNRIRIRRLPALRLLIPGGLASMAFGWLFGSVFSRDDLIPALWLHPLQQPLTVLVVPLAGGIVILLLGLLLNVEPRAMGPLMLTLLVGTPALTFIGLIGAALSVALRRGGLLLAVLVLPLTIPVLIFGVSAANAAIDAIAPFGPPFTILCALTLMSLVLGPVAVEAGAGGAHGSAVAAGLTESRGQRGGLRRRAGGAGARGRRRPRWRTGLVATAGPVAGVAVRQRAMLPP